MHEDIGDEGDGGVYTIFIPRLNRERQTVGKRLRWLETAKGSLPPRPPLTLRPPPDLHYREVEASVSSGDEEEHKEQHVGSLQGPRGKTSPRWNQESQRRTWLAIGKKIHQQHQQSVTSGDEDDY